mmetsp:Transcript_3981/g.9837  ORF Transcript_3981/g.9837 Transcript_3981/m.9837 type:complete len:214 (-) Transcript_3981:139-780(-)
MVARYLPPAPMGPPARRNLVWVAMRIVVRPSWIELWALWFGGARFFAKVYNPYATPILDICLVSIGRIARCVLVSRLWASSENGNARWTVGRPSLTGTRRVRAIPGEISANVGGRCFFGDDFWSMGAVRVGDWVEVQTNPRLGAVGVEREWQITKVVDIPGAGRLGVVVGRNKRRDIVIQHGADTQRFVGWRMADRAWIQGLDRASPRGPAPA